MSSCVQCNAADFILSASALSSSSLDLSRRAIAELPKDFPECSKLESLYLEGNGLVSLPESLFSHCPNLRWLDLRNNRLCSLPPAIERLHSLRTLLLEGNQLFSLPPQLGHLRHLSGLNLAGNPLRSPPRHVIERGTKAVLKYLRERLDGIEEGGNEDSSDSPEPSPLPHTDTTAEGCPAHIPPPTLPLPLMTRATLHSMERRGSRERERGEESPSPQHPTRVHRRRRRRREGRRLTAQEKQEIATAVEKQKNHQCLAEWRDKGRRLQQEQEVKVQLGHTVAPPSASETAPFATEDHGQGEPRSQPSLNVRAGQREAISRVHCNRQDSTHSENSVRAAREREVNARVRRYTLDLQEQRKQVGILGEPSSELLHAERRLAEAMVLRQEMEARAREYRLTAFTGELPMGT